MIIHPASSNRTLVGMGAQASKERDTANEVTFVLHGELHTACAPKDKVNTKFESGGSRLERPLSSGKQTYETNKDLYPLTQPISKLEGIIQCSGEAQYVNDMPPIQGELFGAFVLAETAPYSKVKSVDTAKALAMPGVHAYIDHKDIPGSNSFSPPSYSRTVEPLFCIDKVMYNGQPVGMILAKTHDEAVAAAKMVKIAFEESKEVPAFSIKDALQKNQKTKIIPLVNMEAKRKGENTKKVIKGTFEVDGQYHFTMETQCTICVPTDNGEYDLYCATQWMDHAQTAASKALNIPMNKINVFVKRLGGAYGAKIFRASLVSTACAVAAHKMNKPIRIQLPLIENMKMIGKRMPTTFEYEAGVDDNGLIQHMNITYYQDTGLSGLNETTVTFIPNLIPNSYLNDTWKLTGSVVVTDMPGNAFCRAPGTTESIGMIESVMDHIAYTLNKDPTEVRLANVQPGNDTMSETVKEILAISEYDQRKNAVEDYNSKNRWMKKGISLVIMQYPFEIFGPYSVFVSVYANDGTVSIAHGGTECGQGINTKVAQVCAHTLHIPLDMISIKATNTLTTPNNTATGGSITSEAVCYGTIKACEEILKRLEPVKEKMKNPSWAELVAEGQKQNVELCATHMVTFKQNSTNPVGVLNSKATGEPPSCLSVCIPLAIRRALAAARIDADKNVDQFVPFSGPTTVEYTFQSALNNYKTYTL
ncbi:Aldehyde oxidase 3 [Carabus blaptoides fortunei]